MPQIQTQRQASFVNVSGWRSLKTRTKFELSQILVVILGFPTRIIPTRTIRVF